MHSMHIISLSRALALAPMLAVFGLAGCASDPAVTPGAAAKPAASATAAAPVVQPAVVSAEAARELFIVFPED